MSDRAFPSDWQILQAKVALRELDLERLENEEQALNTRLHNLRVRIRVLQDFVSHARAVLEQEEVVREQEQREHYSPYFPSGSESATITSVHEPGNGDVPA